MIVGLVGHAGRWPTHDNHSPPASFFAGQPVISSYSVDEMMPATPEPVKIQTPSSFSVTQKAMVNSIAATSVLVREDVMGDAETLAAMFSKLWGIPSDLILRCAAASPVLQADLRRAFIASDDVAPQVIAPANVRRALSVSASPAGHTVFGEMQLLDYQRARVAAAAGFYNSTSVQHPT